MISPSRMPALRAAPVDSVTSRPSVSALAFSSSLRGRTVTPSLLAAAVLEAFDEALSLGASSTLTSSVMSLLLRMMESLAIEPGAILPMMTGMSTLSSMALPLTAVMMSPSCRPAFAAGPSFSTWLTIAPLGAFMPKLSARSCVTLWITTPIRPRVTLPFFTS